MDKKDPHSAERQLFQMHKKGYEDMASAIKEKPEIQQVKIVTDESELADNFFRMLRGQKGEIGDKGDSITGNKGDKGDAGKDSTVAGPKGDKGDKGDSIKGDKGDSIKGDKGDSIKGDKGEPGLNGSPDSADDITSKLLSVKKEWFPIDRVAGLRSELSRTSSGRAAVVGISSLKHLTDVDYSGLTQDNKGNYILTSGGTSYTLPTASSTVLGGVKVGAGLTITGDTLSADTQAGVVSSVSVTTANGVSGTVATATTTPAITLVLGAITPTTIGATDSLTISKNVSALNNFIALTGTGAFAGSEPAIAFTNTPGAVTTARISSKPGASYAASNFTIAVADSAKVLQTRLSIDVAGLVNIPSLTASEMLITDASKNVVSAPVATYPSLTELTYVKGVTSAIQTQMNLKAPLASPTFTGTVTVPTPTNGTDAATKAYVDATAQGLAVKESVRVATTAALPTNTYSNGASGVGATLTAVALGALTVDGVAMVLNDRILVKDEVTTANNGIYYVSIAGTAGVAYVLTRSLNMDTTGEFSGAFCFTEEGTTNSESGFVCTSNDPITVGTTAINFTQFSGAGQITAGAGMTKTGNTLDVIGTANRIVVGADAVDIGTDVVTLVGTQTLTNKTLTSPVINTPTGIVKGDVGLSNVDNTSNATERAAVATFTNKRITKRVLSAASYTTNTGTSLNIDNYDNFYVTAQAGALLFNAPSGTPTEGQSLVIRIKDNATARALTWNAIYRAMGTALPSTTVLSKTLYLGFFYNSTDVKWDLVASAQEA